MTDIPASLDATASSPPRGVSTWTQARRRLLSDPWTVLAISVIVLMVLIAIFAPLLSPWDPTRPDRAVNFRASPPSASHPLGTDQAGRDVLSRLLYGTRISLMVGFGSQLLSLVLGIVFGLVAGFYRGWVDVAVSRFIEVLQAFPSLLFIIVLSVSIGPGLLTAYIALGIVGWASVARIVRGQTLSLREADYVEGARAMGASRASLIFRHILPGTLPSLIVIYSIGVGGAIIGEATLSFLGLGVRPPTPSWGQMIADGQSYLTSAWWMSVYPGLAIANIGIAFNFLGDQLRDALDPRMR
jgi:ABC-type dipeptide/oligopeptide/nickel transport system permease subunit